jgi:hypothetical protein
MRPLSQQSGSAGPVLAEQAAGKIGDDFLGEKIFKTELVMAEGFQRVSRLRNCLLSDDSILADALSILRAFRELSGLAGFLQGYVALDDMEDLPLWALKGLLTRYRKGEEQFEKQMKKRRRGRPKKKGQS